jgi:hypothetical protein
MEFGRYWYNGGCVKLTREVRARLRTDLRLSTNRRIFPTGRVEGSKEENIARSGCQMPSGTGFRVPKYLAETKSNLYSGSSHTLLVEDPWPA